METQATTPAAPTDVREALAAQRAESERIGEGSPGAAKREAQALHVQTVRGDAAALAWMLSATGEGDTGHGDTIAAPEEWSAWDAQRQGRWCRAVIRRRESNGLRAGARAPLDVSAALDAADDAPTPERVAEARDSLLACLVLSDDTDRATIRAVADAVGAIVLEATDPEARAAQHRNRARAIRRGLAWRNGLPHGARARIAAALGVSPRLAGKRLERLRANVAPIREALRACGRARSASRVPHGAFV